MVSEHPYTPVLMAFLSAVLWGIWWIPIRYVEGLGMEGAWGTVMMNGGAALIALIWMILRGTPPQIGPRALAGAVLVAGAITSYSLALILGDVVRVVVLFYLAPAWGKIIEWAFMRQPWRWTSTVAIIASLCGAFLVLGGEISREAIGMGDILAVLSGMSWAGGAALIFTGPRSSPLTLTLATATAATALGVLFIWIEPGPGFDTEFSSQAIGAGLLFGVIYVLPILALTLWSAQRLSPAVISFLLTAEILSGVGSGALLLDEPFGWMQAAGAVLILLAAASEVVTGQKPVHPPPRT